MAVSVIFLPFGE